jgi:hypothetical protein
VARDVDDAWRTRDVDPLAVREILDRRDRWRASNAFRNVAEQVLRVPRTPEVVDDAAVAEVLLTAQMRSVGRMCQHARAGRAQPLGVPGMVRTVVRDEYPVDVSE